MSNCYETQLHFYITNHCIDVNICVPVYFVYEFNKINNPVITGENEPINRPFSLEEVKLAIRKLKNNKASGVDNVINEFFKHCHNDCFHMFVDFFNIVLNTGCIPTEWC